MRPVLVGLLAICMGLAGCASPEGLGFTNEPTPAAPYYKEYRETVSGPYQKVFDVPVEPGATDLHIHLTLETRDSGLAVPAAPPASVKLVLFAPDGTQLAERQVSPSAPNATLELEVPAAGLHLLRIDGVGAAQPVEGRTLGAGYLLSVEILYA